MPWPCVSMKRKRQTCTHTHMYTHRHTHTHTQVVDFFISLASCLTATNSTIIFLSSSLCTSSLCFMKSLISLLNFSNNGLIAKKNQFESNKLFIFHIISLKSYLFFSSITSLLVWSSFHL